MFMTDEEIEAKSSEREDRRPRRPGLYDFLKNYLEKLKKNKV
jgi:hypothetical protein